MGHIYVDFQSCLSIFEAISTKCDKTSGSTLVHVKAVYVGPIVADVNMIQIHKRVYVLL